jgi:hypothetical protein
MVTPGTIYAKEEVSFWEPEGVSGEKNSSNTINTVW